MHVAKCWIFLLQNLPYSPSLTGQPLKTELQWGQCPSSLFPWISPVFCSYLLKTLLLLCLCTAFHCGLLVHDSQWVCQCTHLIRNMNIAIKPKLLDISVSQGVQNLNLAPATSSAIGLQLCKSILQISFWNISEIKGWCWNPHPNFTAVGHLSNTDFWKAVRTVLEAATSVMRYCCCFLLSVFLKCLLQGQLWGRCRSEFRCGMLQGHSAYLIIKEHAFLCSLCTRKQIHDKYRIVYRGWGWGRRREGYFILRACWC